MVTTDVKMLNVIGIVVINVYPKFL